MPSCVGPTSPKQAGAEGLSLSFVTQGLISTDYHGIHPTDADSMSVYLGNSVEQSELKMRLI